MFAADAVAESLGIELVEVGAGSAVVRMVVGDDMLNGFGTIHGGILFTLADSALSVACNSHGPTSVAAAASIDFLAPVALGATLVATASESFRRGRTGLYDVTIVDGHGTVARFHGRSHTTA